MPRSFSVTARSAAPPETVFAILADGRRWSEWTVVGRAELEREGDPAPDGVGAVRRFVTGPVTSREEVTVYEPPHRFGYRLLSGVPVRDYNAEVVLTPDAGGTAILWRSSFEARYPLSGPFLHRLLQGMVRDFARRLARRADRSAADTTR